MKKVIVLSGLSGAGKTYARTTNPEWKDLPYIDMADIYQEGASNWGEALDRLLDKLDQLLAEHDLVVVEGYFLPNSTSRGWMDWFSVRRGFEIEYQMFDAPYDVCRQRILDDQTKRLAAGEDEEDVRRSTRARLKLLNIYMEAE